MLTASSFRDGKTKLLQARITILQELQIPLGFEPIHAQSVLTSATLYPVVDLQVGTCFSVVIRGQCVAELTGHYTYRQCCCDKGRCWTSGPSPKLCPFRGSGE